MNNYFDNYIRAVTNPLPEMAEYFEKENNYLKDLINKESIVLDVGCGNGRTMKFLAPFVKKIIGIDYNEKMIAAAKKNLAARNNIELIYADFFNYKFAEKFDLIYASFNLLGSCETGADKRLPLLLKMIKKTKTGGHVVASVWSDTGIDFARKYYPAIGDQVLEIRGNDVVTKLGIFKRFSKKELEDLGNSTGKKFKIIELTKIFYLIDIVV